MRKERWFRSALLSVLFFGLLLGAAPVLLSDPGPTGSMDSNQSECQARGGIWVPPDYSHRHGYAISEGYCSDKSDICGDATEHMIGMTILGFGGAVNPGIAFGAALGFLDAAATFLGNDCHR